MNRSWLSQSFPVRRRTPITRKPSQRAGLKVQTLEDRTVPSTFTVTNVFDNGSEGSLRWAISEANTNDGDDTIAFDGSFDTETPQIITLNGTQLEIDDATGTTNIQGPSVGVTIDADEKSRVFEVKVNARAAFDGLTITGGQTNEEGGGVLINRGGRLAIANSTIDSNSAIVGGGIKNDNGSLTISYSVISNNTSTSGGGIANYGAMNIDRSTITGNTVRDISPYDYSSQGGGIWNSSYKPSIITNSTISYNTAALDNNSNNAAAFGGGLSQSAGKLTIVNCTISNNETVGHRTITSGAGIHYNKYEPPTSITITNSTISENYHRFKSNQTSDGTKTTPNDILFRSNDYYEYNATITNTIISSFLARVDAPYGISGENNIIGRDAKLGPLQDNGGPTHTMALLEGSPAINAGMPVDGITTDQRGYGRDPFRIDIGAYEWGATPPPAIIAPSSTFVYDNESTTLNGLGVVLDNSVHLSAALRVEHGTLSLGSGSVLTDLDPMPNGVIILGPIKQLNAALKTIQYLGRLGETSTDKLSIEVGDFNYNRVETSVMISIYSLPTLTAPERQTTYLNEDLLIDGISIEGGAPGDFTVTLNATQGTLNVDVTNVVVTNNNTGSVTVTGTSANINTALATLVYTGNSAGSDTLAISATDSGGKNAVSTVNIAVYTIPTLAVPGSQTVYVNDDLLIDGISIEGGAPGDFTVTLIATQGTLNVDDTNVDVTNNNAGSVTVTGTSANINTALATLVYNGNSAGSDTLAISATDSGGKNAVSTVNIAVYTIPTLAVPGSQTVYVNEDLLIDGISIEGGAPGDFTVTLIATQGTLNVDETNVVVTNNNTGSVTVTGTSANINTALATLVYNGNSAGSDELSITATDSGGKNAESTVSIAVYALPTLTVPGNQTAYEDVDSSIDGIAVNGGAPGNLTVTLSTGHGTLTLGSTAGLEVTDNGAGSITLTGSADNINAALSSLTYRGLLNFSGSDTLSITATDSGGKQASSSIAINVLSVADQLEILRNEVRTLKGDGTLNKGQATALLASLNLKGNKGDFGKLQSFINKVNDFMLEGILSQEQADSLRTKAENLLIGMTRK